MNPSLLLLACAAVATASPYLAQPALLLNDAKPSQADLKANGVVAHVCDGGFGGATKVEIKRLSDGEKFRIVMDPRLRGQGAVALQQLPPGSYVGVRLFLADRDPLPFSSDTFEVKPGRVTSFGKVRVAPETNMLGLMKRLLIQTDSVDIRPRLASVKEFGIDTLPVVPKPLDWKIEPEEVKVDKHLAP